MALKKRRNLLLYLNRRGNMVIKWLNTTTVRYNCPKRVFLGWGIRWVGRRDWGKTEKGWMKWKVSQESKEFRRFS